MQITGTVHEIGKTQVVSDKFKKRDLVIEYAENPTYPEYVKMEFHQDKCEKADELRKGDNITVDFNLKGKPYTNKEGVTSYFNSLVVWKFGINQTSAGDMQEAQISNNDDESGDLPF
jgi:hypothetical protein